MWLERVFLESFDGDHRGGYFVKTVVPGPMETDGSAFSREREESKEWVSRDRRREVCAKYLFPIIAALEISDDIAGNGSTGLLVTEPGLHNMGNQDLNLNKLTRFGVGRNINQRAGRHSNSPPQAASVTITSKLADQ